MFKACIGLNCARHVDFLDRRHGSLTHIPDEVYRNEEHLEELLLDMNGLQDLPPKFFRLTNLRKLSVSENELLRLSPHISSLTRLVELDVSKNALDEIPDSIRFCRSLSILEISSNPLLKVPECLTSIKSLTVLMMNDCSLPRLPTEIGSLENLVVLEARENLLKSVPRSIAQLKRLQRLDLGNNEIEELIGALETLEELQLDSNQLKELPDDIGRLSNLLSVDVTKNKLEFLPTTINHLCNLKDLHVSENLLTTVPDSIGEMNHLLTLKLDMNRLLDLPDTLGGLSSLTELFLFENMIDNVPASLFDMPALQMLDLSRNHIIELPHGIGHCGSLRVLCLRDNELTAVPDELGSLKELQVLDLSGNRLLCLPMSFRRLDLDALWLSDLQRQPLIPLHPAQDPENSDRMVLMCSALPQKSSEDHSVVSSEGEERRDDVDKKVVAFDPNIIGARSDSFKNTRHIETFTQDNGPETAVLAKPKLVRFPTPRRREGKGEGKKSRRSKHKPNPEMPVGAPIFRKLKADEVVAEDEESITDAKLVANGDVDETDPQDDLGRSDWRRQHVIRKKAPEVVSPPSSEKKPGTVDLCESVQKSGPADATPDLLQSTGRALVPSSTSPPTGPSTLQTVEVTIELVRIPGKSLGFSIAGGRGSTPAYEDVDDSIFITKVAPGGVAKADGRLRLGDKLLSVNGQSMSSASHHEAVGALKAATESCLLVVSREVLVVMPSSTATPSPTPAVASDATKPEKIVERSTSQELREFGMKIAAVHQEKPTVCVEETGPIPTRQQGEESALPGATVVPVKQQEEEESVNEEVGQKMQSLALEISNREREGFVAMDADKEDVPVERKEVESKGRPSKQSGDYANLDIAKLIQPAEDGEGDGSEKGEGSPDRDLGGPDQLSSVPAELSDSDSSSDSDSDSDVVVLRPDMQKEQSPYPEELVVLKRGTGLLGLKIVGGVDHVCRPFGDGEPGIFVSRVTPGGAAAASGKLKVGDRILQVNSVDVRSARHETAVSLLIERRETITLLVCHVPPPPGLQEITLVKGLHDKLGLSIRGGMKTDYTDEGGIYISKVIPGGAASKDGRLVVGQRILEVNAQSLLGASHMDAVRALRGVQEKLTMLVCDGFKPEELEMSMPVSKKNSSLNNSTEILAIEETEKQVNSMISDLGAMEDSSVAESKPEKEEGQNEGVEQRQRIMMSPSGMFELPPEASDQITSLHKEMEEMKESVEKEAKERVEQLEKQKQEKSVEGLHQLKEIEELERQAEQAEERSRTLRDEARRKSEAADKKLQDFATELEEQRKRDHEERLDRAARSVSEEVEPEFLASVMDEMTGLTSEISEELDKSCSGASVTNEVEVAMVAPEVTVVAPEESLESEPIVNGDGKSVEPSLEEPPRESNEVPSTAMASSEVAVSVTQQSTDKQEEVPTEKPTMREDKTEEDSSEDAASFRDRLKFHEQAIREITTSAKRSPSPHSSKTKTYPLNVETRPPRSQLQDEIRESVDNRPLGSIKERMAAFQSNGAGVGVSGAAGAKSSEWSRAASKPANWRTELQGKKQFQPLSVSASKEKQVPPKTTVSGEEGDGVTVEQHHHDQLSAEESSMAANPYVAAILANMPTGLPWQPEEPHSDKDVVRPQHSHKLHKEMELIEESIRQTRLYNSRTAKGENPYLECVLKGMPPVVSTEEVELGDHGDERRRRWREQKQAELDRSVQQTQEAIDRARTAQQ